jgi:REP element-mobilizing transposase RayT
MDVTMPKPRRSQISLTDTPYYHCVSRCVRRSFLCGEDSATGKNYEHRRQWVEDRLLELGQVFSIDVYAYAVMSNHAHIVLHVNAQQAKSWSVIEVLERWHQLHQGTYLTKAYLDEGLRSQLDESQLQTALERAEVYRVRLYCGLTAD